MATAPTSTLSDDTIRFIDPKAVVNISVSTGYYERVQGMLRFFIDGKTGEELLEAKRLVETNQCQPGTWQDQYLTTLIFCKAFEEQIEQQGLFRVASAEEATNLMR